MTDCLVDVAWNHKGARYERRAVERVKASSAVSAIPKAIAETKRRYPGSLREAVGARFHIDVTVLGQEETT